jgi:hypothetical protein
MAQTQSVTPLRQRMLDDMRLRNLAAGTRRIYVRSVAGFSTFHGRSPDQLTLEDVRDYQLHCKRHLSGTLRLRCQRRG